MVICKIFLFNQVTLYPSRNGTAHEEGEPLQSVPAPELHTLLLLSFVSYGERGGGGGRTELIVEELCALYDKL